MLTNHKAELTQLRKERDEARNINGFALNKDYYEKFQHLRADVELKEAEIAQLCKVCDELAECLEAASQLLIDEGYRSHKHDCNTILKNYSTLPHVIKTKGK